jgi:hypothetical protein
MICAALSPAAREPAKVAVGIAVTGYPYRNPCEEPVGAFHRYRSYSPFGTVIIHGYPAILQEANQ